jgi:hypothetical protein
MIPDFEEFLLPFDRAGNVHEKVFKQGGAFFVKRGFFLRRQEENPPFLFHRFPVSPVLFTQSADRAFIIHAVMFLAAYEADDIFQGNRRRGLRLVPDFEKLRHVRREKELVEKPVEGARFFQKALPVKPLKIAVVKAGSR